MITTPLWWGFLLVSPIVYWLTPEAYRARLLAVMSLGLLLYYAPADILVLSSLAAFVFFAPRLKISTPWLAWLVRGLGNSTWLVTIVLIYFLWAKYLPAIALAFSHQASFLDLVVPLGISYFSFKLLHYTIERGRGTLPDHRFDDFLSYMFLAPIFTAGPIERFDHYLKHRAPEFEWTFVAEGLVRIGQGLVKKFILGTLVLELMQRIHGGSLVSLLDAPSQVAVWQVWAMLFLALLYSYFDFAAYSDIAIGSSRLFGLRIAENFNMPLIATSLRDFWQRWHMTLASWVLTYVYLPLVGHTRNPYASIIISFGVVGIWHTAWPLHWLFWGLWHGVGLAILIWWTRQFQKRRSKFLQRRPVRVLGWAITIGYVTLSEAFPALYGLAPVSDSFRLVAMSFGF